MRLIELGTTGVMLPAIGQGTWKYTAGAEPLRRGVELGACLIDTAEAYGTEETVGEALRGLRERVFVATKVSAAHLAYQDVLAAADRSLEALATDHIDLYQVHWPNPRVPIAETMAAMEALVTAGKVRFVGVSNFSVAQLKEAQAAMSRYRIVSNQVGYSLADRKHELDLLPYCRSTGVTVLAYSPLGGSLSNLHRWDAQNALPALAAALGKTTAQVALTWCLAKENVVVLPKASSVSRVEENCGASAWRLSAAQLERLEASFRRRTPVEDAVRGLARRVLARTGHAR
ncbi:MAG: aldo/keto reductase [Deltaproteobacteria bacterium]|nr:aldo/keto reductase [Deltaproteobacteria bacterium]